MRSSRRTSSGQRRGRHGRARGLSRRTLGRFALALLAGVILAWPVLIRGLPYYLAQDHAELGLILSPSHPAPLLAEAESLRADLLSVVPSGWSSDAHGPQEKDQAAGGPSLEEVQAKEARIRALAEQVIVSDPLNARAFSLLGEMAPGEASARGLMLDAEQRFRHDTVAVFWLLNDSYRHQDFAQAVAYADVLLRTRPQLTKYVLAYLGDMAGDPRGRSEIVHLLAARAPWRPSFFAQISPNVRDLGAPFTIMLALRSTAQPVTLTEASPYASFLVGKGLVDTAYNVFLQLQASERLQSLGFLSNPDFAEEPSGMPFDWKLSPGRNGLAELIDGTDKTSEHVLHISLAGGRVKFPEVSQTLTLAQGTYQLQGKVKGRLDAIRPVLWEVRCLFGARAQIGHSDPLSGDAADWRGFALDIVVPPGEDCRGQSLRLFHDSRSASEELATGDLWLAHLNLSRVQR